MKKLLLLICFIVSANFLLAQNGSPLYPVTQNLGNGNTLVNVGGGQRITGAFVLGHFVDTAAANAVPYVKNYANGIITTDTNQVWFRTYNAQRWIQFFVNNPSPTGDTLVWKMSGNYVADRVTPPVLGTKTFTELPFIVNDTTRMTIPVYGIQRTSSPQYKYLMIDTAYGGNYYLAYGDGGSGSSYTFPYSVVAPGGAIQLENDTTDNPANYFYGRNSAGRRGWYPQSSITGVNIYNSDGTLTGSRTIDGDGNDLEIVNIASLNISVLDQINLSSMGSALALTNTNAAIQSSSASTTSQILVFPDSIKINPHLGNLKIDTLNATTDTTGKSLVIRNLTTGLLENIDPALIGGGSSLFPTTGTGTATGNVTGDLDGNDLIITGGNVGIGTATPSAFFEVVPGAASTSYGRVGVYDTDAGYFRFLGDGNTTFSGHSAEIYGNPEEGLLSIFRDGSSISSVTLLNGVFIDATEDVKISATDDVLIQPLAGNVGIGTSTPAAILHTVGTVRHETLGTASTDTTTYKPVGINSSGDIIPMTYWPVSGGGSTPAGNYGNVQINRNGALSTPASDSLGYTSSNGLIVKNKIGITTGTPAATRFETNGTSGNSVIMVVADGVKNYLGAADNTPAGGEHYLSYSYSSNFGILEASHPASGNFVIRNVGAGGFYLQSAAAQPVILYAASTQILTATSAGVGVGTSATSPNSTLQVGGSFSGAYVAKTGSYTLTAADFTVSNTSGSNTMTLPTAVGITGRIYYIVNTDAAATVTVATTSSQTFVNFTATPTTLTKVGLGTFAVQSNGANWLLLSNY